jgi:hypothetical protein
MKMAVFWNDVLFSLALMMDAVKYLWNASQVHSTQCNIPEDSHLHTRHCDKLKYPAT